MWRLDRLKPRVLVTGIGGPAAQGFIKAFPHGEVDWVVADMDPAMPGFQLFDPDRRAIVPRGEEPGFADSLLAIALQARVDAVVPTVDTELLPLARARGRFEEAGIRVLVASESTLETCLDKLRLMDRLAGWIRVPTSAAVDESLDPTRFAGPVVTKPRSGSGGRGIRLHESIAAIGPDVPRDGSHLVQDLLPGEEYSIDVLATGGGRVIAAVPRHRIRTDSGIATVARTVADQRLQDYGAAIAKALELTTVANVQVKLDEDGHPRLLEVNPRFPGTMSLTVAAGVNMPRLALFDLLGGMLPERLPFKEAVMVRTWSDTLVDPTTFAHAGLMERAA